MKTLVLISSISVVIAASAVAQSPQTFGPTTIIDASQPTLRLELNGDYFGDSTFSYQHGNFGFADAHGGMLSSNISDSIGWWRWSIPARFDDSVSPIINDSGVVMDLFSGGGGWEDVTLALYPRDGASGLTLRAGGGGASISSDGHGYLGFGPDGGGCGLDHQEG
jgi:hypothetical protein